jgi:hypothetical protein
MGKAEYALELALNFKIMVVEGFAIFFYRHAIMIIATMSAKGVHLSGMVAALISWFTSPLLVLLLCLFLFQPVRGFWDAD